MRSLTQWDSLSDLSSPLDDFEGDLDGSDIELVFEGDEGSSKDINEGPKHADSPSMGDSGGGLRSDSEQNS